MRKPLNYIVLFINKSLTALQRLLRTTAIYAARGPPVRKSATRCHPEQTQIHEPMADTRTSNSSRPPGATAALALADGTVFWGRGLGAAGQAVGEVCFNTSMTGYQEIMTDPSYAGQIITFTFPHIGNTGTNTEDIETTTPAALGCVSNAGRHHRTVELAGGATFRRLAQGPRD